jgi:hypothetical protein
MRENGGQKTKPWLRKKGKAMQKLGADRPLESWVAVKKSRMFFSS